MAKKLELKVVDTSDLDDGDWAAINQLKRIYEINGPDAFWAAIQKLYDDDPVRHVKSLCAFFPAEMSEAVKDSLADAGITREEAYEMLRKAQRRPDSPAGDQ